MRNVILSFTSSYSFYEIQPFIESWKRTQEADLYVFYLDISQWTKDCLEYSGARFICVDEDLRDKNYDYEVLRMIMSERFLRKNSGVYDQVALVDIRDVVFQNSLFFGEGKKDYLDFNLENITHNRNGWQSACNIRLLGNDSWKSKYGDKLMINGGVFYGTVKEMSDFLNVAIKYCVDRESFFGIDQTAINYVVYEGLIKDNIIYDSAKNGMVVSIIHNLFDYKIADGNIVSCECGRAPSIVHQYDRSEMLTKFVNKMYRNETPCILNDYYDIRSKLEIIKFLVLKKDLKNVVIRLTELGGKLENKQKICFSIIDDILKEIQLQEGAVYNFIRNQLLAIVNDIFAKVSISEKLALVEKFIILFKMSIHIDNSIIDRFGEEIFKVVKHYVDVDDWSIAERYVNEISSLKFRNNDKLYILCGLVYKNVFRIDDAKRCYDLACNITLRKKVIGLDFESYISALHNLKYSAVIFIVTNDTHGHHDRSKIKGVDKLGISTDLSNTLGCSWLCVIDEGEIIKEKFSKDEKVSTVYRREGNIYKLSSEGYNASIKKGYTGGASVTSNGKEFCVNKRGLNFVVMDKASGLMIDSVAFDMYNHEKVYRSHLDLC